MIRFHLSDLHAAEHAPLLCCKVAGCCEEYGCPVHFCITSLPLWQGFQHTSVGTLEESLEDSEVPSPPMSILSHGAFSKCLKPQKNSALAQNHTELVYIPNSPSSCHRCQIANGMYFHQDRFRDKSNVAELQHLCTCRSTSLSHQRPWLPTSWCWSAQMQEH